MGITGAGTEIGSRGIAEKRIQNHKVKCNGANNSGDQPCEESKSALHSLFYLRIALNLGSMILIASARHRNWFYGSHCQASKSGKPPEAGFAAAFGRCASRRRLTSKMSHERGWREPCVSTDRDRRDRWLWRLVRPNLHRERVPLLESESRPFPHGKLYVILRGLLRPSNRKLLLGRFWLFRSRAKSIGSLLGIRMRQTRLQEYLERRSCSDPR